MPFAIRSRSRGLLVSIWGNAVLFSGAKKHPDAFIEYDDLLQADRLLKTLETELEDLELIEVVRVYVSDSET